MEQSENANLSLIAALQAKIASLSLENQQLAQIIKVTQCKKCLTIKLKLCRLPYIAMSCHDRQPVARVWGRTASINSVRLGNLFGNFYKSVWWFGNCTLHFKEKNLEKKMCIASHYFDFQHYLSFLTE